MSSEDVIELGSSDEDTEPAPKRRKPPSNIMVQIPSKLPGGVTIKPTKSGSKLNPACINKGTLGKSVTVTKVLKSNLILNPYANKSKPNGKTVKVQVSGKGNLPKPAQQHVAIPTVNECGNVPIFNSNILQKHCSSPFQRKVIGPTNPIRQNKVVQNRLAHNKIIRPNVSSILKNVPMVVAKGSGNKHNSKPFSSFPPGLTIKKTSTLTKNAKLKVYANNKNKTNEGQTPCQIIPNEVLTVELDDDEPATSSSGPQWYLSPEDPQDQNKSKESTEKNSTNKFTHSENKTKKSPNKDEKETSLALEKLSSPDKASNKETKPLTDPLSQEDVNNKEPDKLNFIEITIEDSPIKSVQNKKGFRMGAELAITIDDSPIKSAADKTPPGSDSEDDHIENVKEKKSKKKLEYAKKSGHVIEIEIEPLNVEPKSNSNDEEVNNCKEKETASVIVIEESPLKPAETENIGTPKKNKHLIQSPKPQVKMNEMDSKALEVKEKEAFHPVYQCFIDLCLKLENSQDMEKIIEKKIKSYYQQVPKEYTESEMFVEIVTSKIAAMKAAPEKMYLYIKDVVDELDVQRKLAKQQAEAKKEEEEKFLYGEESEFDSKRQRQIRKLEKTLKKLHRAIQKLEEQEVDFDDEEDSVYLLTERYKERMVRVHAKLCQLTNTKMPSEPRISIDARPGQPKGPAKRLEKWINKKVPIGTPLPFPDFHDVLRCVREANQQDNLGWNEADIMEEARDLFTRCGKKLQRRRQENEWRLAASRIQTYIDPAEDSDDLKKKLEDNKRVAAKRESEVLNKYADRQNQLNLEAVEIGDKEAEESPVESDDEEPNNDGESLENKEKRKERLKRLLHEKSKKSNGRKKIRSEQADRRQPVVEKSLNDNTDVGGSDKSGTSAEIDNKKKQDGKKDDTKETCKENNPDTPKNPVKIIDIDLVELEIPANKDEGNDKTQNGEADNVHSLSDDSSKIESDIDELHLLQKLHSEAEMNSSTLESSDSDSPIAISDGTITDDDNSCENRKQSADVISIENSSFSESEEKKDDGEKTNKIVSEMAIIEENKEPIDSNEPKNCSDVENEKTNSNDNESMEDVLLASSDEVDKEENIHDETCINLRDDNISIGETLIEDIQSNLQESKNANTDNDICVELKEKSIPTGETPVDDIQANNHHGEDIELNKNGSRNKTVADCSSVESMDIGPDIEENCVKENAVSDIIESSQDGSSEISTVNSIESEEANICESTSIKSVEIIEDSNKTSEQVHLLDNKLMTIEGSGEIHHNNDKAMDIVEKTENGSVEETVESSSTPEAMDVDCDK